MEHKDKIQICAIVCQAILIDGQLTDTEHTYLEDLMNEFDLTPEERKEVMRRNIGDDVNEMASLIGSHKAKERVIHEVAKVINVDGIRSRVENRLLKKVSLGVGFDKETVMKLLGE